MCRVEDCKDSPSGDTSTLSMICEPIVSGWIEELNCKDKLVTLKYVQVKYLIVTQRSMVYTTLGRHRMGGPLALAAGNRNIALFLVALPAEVMAPIMVFVGCWQVPMYLTPVLLRWLYARKALHE